MGYRGELTPEQVVVEEAELTPEYLDKWSAEKVMGFTPIATPLFKTPSWYQDEFTSQFRWHPSDPTTGQIWMVIEKMKEKGWEEMSIHRQFVVDHPDFKEWSGNFAACFRERNGLGKYLLDKNPCIAILKAAYEALEGD